MTTSGQRVVPVNGSGVGCSTGPMPRPNPRLSLPSRAANGCRYASVRRLAGLTVLLLVFVARAADDAPRITKVDGLTCLNDAALVASERDREATRLQLREAQAVSVVPVFVAGALGVAVGVGVALLVSGARKP